LRPDAASRATGLAVVVPGITVLVMTTMIARLVAQRLAERLHRLENEAVEKPVLSDGVGTITKLASLFWTASFGSSSPKDAAIRGDQLVELRLDHRHLAGIQGIDEVLRPRDRPR
jgi:hypothetical protein